MLSLPLGLAYFAVLAVGFGLVPGALSGSAWLLGGTGPVALAAAVGCLAVGVIALPAMLPVLDGVRRLAGFERRLNRALLGGSSGLSFAKSVATGRGPWRRVADGLRDIRLARALTYLVVKAPFAVLGFAVVAGAAALIGLLVLAPLLVSTAAFSAVYTATDIQPGIDAWLCVLVAFPVTGLALQTVNGLAWVAAELARLLLAPADTARYEWTESSTTR